MSVSPTDCSFTAVNIPVKIPIRQNIQHTIILVLLFVKNSINENFKL